MGHSLLALEALDPSEVLALIGRAFGQSRTPEWYQWKHVEGPWGPSIGLGAVEDGRLLGIRLLLPWGLHIKGQPVRCFRAVEAATHPDAQGRGLFSELNTELMRSLAASGPTVLFSTPNQNSRRAYRRLGWSWIGPIPHRYGPMAFRPGPVTICAEATIAPPFPGTPGQVVTQWDPHTWRWRTDPRCGQHYQTRWTLDSTGTHGMTYRLTKTHGVRCALVLASWGRRELVRRVATVVALDQRVPILLEASGASAAPPIARHGLTQGGSLLAVWTSDDQTLGAARDISLWRTNFADLESVL